jgi:hypothetical protein
VRSWFLPPKMKAARTHLFRKRRGGDPNGSGIVVKHHPARTAVAIAHRPDVLPYLSVPMQLIQVAASSTDGDGLIVVVEPFPPRA